MDLPLVVASGEVRGGRLHLHDRQAFQSALSGLREGTQVEIHLARLLAHRSMPQNRYYWSVVVGALVAHTGYTPEEMHEFLKVKFLPKTMGVSNGQGDLVAEFVVAGSTRRLDVAAFAKYVEDVKMWAAADLQVYIPDADERGYGAGI